MATYYITGVWKNDDHRITHVMLHRLNDNGTWTRGAKTSEQDVIRLIDNDHNVSTRIWNYTNAVWAPGARVIVVNEFGRRILRTVPDARVTDNLDNSIRMEFFIA